MEFLRQCWNNSISPESFITKVLEKSDTEIYDIAFSLSQMCSSSDIYNTNIYFFFSSLIEKQPFLFLDLINSKDKNVIDGCYNFLIKNGNLLFSNLIIGSEKSSLLAAQTMILVINKFDSEKPISQFFSIINQLIKNPNFLVHLSSVWNFYPNEMRKIKNAFSSFPKPEILFNNPILPLFYRIINGQPSEPWHPSYIHNDLLEYSIAQFFSRPGSFLLDSSETSSVYFEILHSLMNDFLNQPNLVFPFYFTSLLDSIQEHLNIPKDQLIEPLIKTIISSSIQSSYSFRNDIYGYFAENEIFTTSLEPQSNISDSASHSLYHFFHISLESAMNVITRFPEGFPLNFKDEVQKGMKHINQGMNDQSKLNFDPNEVISLFNVESFVETFYEYPYLIPSFQFLCDLIYRGNDFTKSAVLSTNLLNNSNNVLHFLEVSCTFSSFLNSLLNCISRDLDWSTFSPSFIATITFLHNAWSPGISYFKNFCCVLLESIDNPCTKYFFSAIIKHSSPKDDPNYVLSDSEVLEYVNNNSTEDYLTITDDIGPLAQLVNLFIGLMFRARCEVSIEEIRKTISAQPLTWIPFLLWGILRHPQSLLNLTSTEQHTLNFPSEQIFIDLLTIYQLNSSIDNSVNQEKNQFQTNRNWIPAYEITNKDLKLLHHGLSLTSYIRLFKSSLWNLSHIVGYKTVDAFANIISNFEAWVQIFGVRNLFNFVMEALRGLSVSSSDQLRISFLYRSCGRFLAIVLDDAAIDCLITYLSNALDSRSSDGVKSNDEGTRLAYLAWEMACVPISSAPSRLSKIFEFIDQYLSSRGIDMQNPVTLFSLALVKASLTRSSVRKEIPLSLAEKFTQIGEWRLASDIFLLHNQEGLDEYGLYEDPYKVIKTIIDQNNVNQ